MTRALTVLSIFASAVAALAQIDTLVPRENYLARETQTLNLRVIPGLLQNEKRACPIGGTECSDGDGCCATAQRCCSDGGCCQLTFSCVDVGGVKGCCPAGSTCTSSSGRPTSTSATAPYTTKFTAITSVPTPTANTHDVTVALSSLSLSGQWEDATSSCDSSAKSKLVYSNGTVSQQYSTAAYSFRGSAVFLKFSHSNPGYAIFLDGNTTEYGGIGGIGAAELPPNCTYWWRDGLGSSEHRLQIAVYGSGNSSDTENKPWVVELHSVVITQSGSGASSDAGTTTSVQTASPTGAAASVRHWSALVLALFTGVGIVCTQV